MKRIIFLCIIVITLLIVFLKEESGPTVSQNGISTNQLADNIISKYDRNSDGILDVNGESFLRIKLDDVLKVESRGLLFIDSDKFGNNDGSVSKVELENYLKEFDKNNDGEITSYKNIFDSIINGKSEWSDFDKKYAEKYKYEKMSIEK